MAGQDLYRSKTGREITLGSGSHRSLTLFDRTNSLPECKKSHRKWQNKGRTDRLPLPHIRQRSAHYPPACLSAGDTSFPGRKCCICAGRVPRRIGRRDLTAWGERHSGSALWDPVLRRNGSSRGVSNSRDGQSGDRSHTSRNRNAPHGYCPMVRPPNHLECCTKAR